MYIGLIIPIIIKKINYCFQLNQTIYPMIKIIQKFQTSLNDKKYENENNENKKNKRKDGKI